MTIIKRAIQDEIDNMNHEPESIYEGQWFNEYPEIDWENIYFRLLDALEGHIDIDSLPKDIHLAPKEVLEQVIEEAKDSKWVDVMLEEARSGYRERVKLEQSPYETYGIARNNF